MSLSLALARNLASLGSLEQDTAKLQACAAQYGIAIPEVHEAYEQCFIRMAKNIAAAK